MSAASFANRTYTPLAFREETERWLILALATIVAVLYLVVIPLELVLHSRANDRAATPTQPAGNAPG